MPGPGRPHTQPGLPGSSPRREVSRRGELEVGDVSGAEGPPQWMLVGAPQQAAPWGALRKGLAQAVGHRAWAVGPAGGQEVSGVLCSHSGQFRHRGVPGGLCPSSPRATPSGPPTGPQQGVREGPGVDSTRASETQRPRAPPAWPGMVTQPSRNPAASVCLCFC